MTIILFIIDLVGRNGMTCVDNSHPELLPPPCGNLDEISSCYEFEWHVGRQKSTFDICECMMKVL